MKRWIKWGVAVLVLAGGAYGASRYVTGSRVAPVRYETARAEKGRISAKVTATGALSALVTVQVGSQVSGRIETLRADFGSRVKKGDIIATIDSQLFRASLQQARANKSSAVAGLEKARVQAEDAQRQWSRSRSLVGQKLIAQADADTTEANAKAAQAQVLLSQAAIEQSVASLRQAEINLAYTTIISPIDGVVVSRSIDVGQTVAASFQAPTLFTIAQDLAKMQVDTNVSEADVGRVKAGMAVSFVVDAFPDKQFAGVVRQVRDNAQTVQNVVTYDAVIDVANPELLLKPGMTANVTFVYADRDEVLRVPNAALRFRPDPEALAAVMRASGQGRARAGKSGDTGPSRSAGAGAGASGSASSGAAGRRKAGAVAQAKPGERLVWVVQDDQPEAKSVRAGLTDGTWTELLSGAVKEGDRLITEMIVDPSALPQKRPF
jgi:HlyD family secretion protein